jgi:hypothetical protein
MLKGEKVIGIIAIDSTKAGLGVLESNRARL